MYIGKKLAAGATIIGAAVLSGGLAAAPATAAPLDAGIHLVTGHNVGVYGWYHNIDDNHKVASNLLYSGPLTNPATNAAFTDGVDADCYNNTDGDDLGSGKKWYHVAHEYYNHNSTHADTYAWVYAPYVDGGAAITNHLIPNCGY